MFWVDRDGGVGDILYATSTDGSSWSSSTTVRSATCGDEFSVWFDGTYVHYAWAWISNIFYRRGTPNADGTISWSAAEQEVDLSPSNASYAMVSVDSNGYAWVAYIDNNNYARVIKSGNNNGTWGTTPAGFPHELTSDGIVWYPSIIPLTSGRMLAVYGRGIATLRVKRWNGSNWSIEKASSTQLGNGWCYSAAPEGDDAHIVFTSKTSPYPIKYVKYVYSSDSLSSEETARSSTVSNTTAPAISVDSATSDIYMFWSRTDTDKIYYRKRTTVWETEVEWLDETTDTIGGDDRLSSYHKDFNGEISLTYTTKAASPYSVKFEELTAGQTSTYKTFTVDAYIQRTLTKTTQADAVLLATGSKLKTLSADALLQTTLTKTFHIDAIVGAATATPAAAEVSRQPALDSAICGFCRSGYCRCGVYRPDFERVLQGVKNVPTPKKAVIGGAPATIGGAECRVGVYRNDFEGLKKTMKGAT